MNYYKGIVIIFLLTLTFKIGIAQTSPVFEWQDNYGGSGIDAGSKIIACTNGDFLVAGNSESSNGNVSSNKGSRDAWIVRLNPSGQIIWEKNFGGSKFDVATSAIELMDGNFIVTGYTSSTNGDVTNNHGSFDAWLLKISSSGSLQWQKTFGGTNNDFAESVSFTADGGYILGGSSYSNNGNVTGNHGDEDFWVVKTDSLGVIQWQRSVGGSGYEQCFSAIVLNDGTYLAVGVSNSNNGDLSGSHGGYDCMVARIDQNGNLMQAKLYGGKFNESAFSCVQYGSGQLAIAGYTNSSNDDINFNRGSSDVWVIRTDINGNMFSSKTYGGSYSDVGYSIALNSTGFMIACGTTSNDLDVLSNHGGEDVWIIQTDSSGNILWSNTYGGTSGDRPSSFVGGYDNGFKVCGYSSSSNGDLNANKGNSDLWIYKLGCPTPDAFFNTPIDSVCLGGSILFTNASSNVVANDWIVDGSYTSSVSDLNFTFNTPGNIVVELVGKTCLSLDKFTKAITVTPAPRATVTSTQNFLCNYDSVLLQSSSADGYLWNNGSNSQATYATSAGLYYLEVTIAGCRGYSDSVFIYNHPIQTFSLGADTTICKGSNYWLTAPAGFVSYQWQDGSSYQSFIATTPGVYAVKVNDGVCSYIDSIEIDTVDCYLPIARFSASKTMICEDESVDFTDLSDNATSWLWQFPGGVPSTSTSQNPHGIIYSAPGNYDVTLIINNANGSNASYMRNYMLVNSLPVKPVINATGPILVSSTQAAVYQWYKDSVAIAGANSQAYIAPQSGNYTVAVTSSHGCTSTSDPLSVIITGVGIIQSEESSFLVYPNPSTGSVSINFLNPQTSEFKLDILNIAGQIVYSDYILTNKNLPTELKLEHLPAGFYILNARNSSEFYTSRLQLIR